MNLDTNILSQLRKAFGRYIPPPTYDEEEIVWLEDPFRYEFLREMIVQSQRRRGRPKYRGNGRVIGYSNLCRNASRKWGYFERRLFYLRKEDLLPDCAYRLYDFMPAEGIRPQSLFQSDSGNAYDREVRL